MAVCNTNKPLLLHFFSMSMVLLSLQIPFARALSFNLSSFSSDKDNITYERAFSNDQNNIQLASSNAMIGWATYSKPMHLWHNANRRLTDFTTRFSFVIDSDNKTDYGDGIAFFLAPQGSKIPKYATKGGSLGLTNDGEESNSTSNSFVAVEFDIYKNPWDPPREHVGIDINSMKSMNSVTWWSANSIRDGQMNEAWINYNSSTQNLSVVFTGFRDNVTVMQYLDYKVDLRLHLPEFVTFGFSAATGNASAKHTIHSWEFSSSLDDNLQPRNTTPVLGGRGRGRSKKIGLAAGLSTGGGVLVVGLILAWLARIGRSKDENEEEDDHGFNSMDDEFENKTGPKKFSYNELARATNDFNDEQKLGQGGFGVVYKGILRDTNSYIAVKKVSKRSKQGIKEYASEVRIISRLRHRNLVQLLGWCHEKKQLMLIYEFMPNGSLDSHLFRNNRNLLTWEVRYKIAQDLAIGLLYLHEEWEQCVLHRDIKASNIMLDSNFNAKLGDFGLARLVDHAKGSQTTGVAGTMGYMAPEYLTTSKASKESDVFSFGVVTLEIACGRRSIEHESGEDQVSLVPWVWESYGNQKLLDIADRKLCMNFDVKQMECLMIVGLWCAHPDSNLRPSIKQVIQILNFELSLPNLPSKMPAAKYDVPTTPMVISSSYKPSLSLTVPR